MTIPAGGSGKWRAFLPQFEGSSSVLEADMRSSLAGAAVVMAMLLAGPAAAQFDFDPLKSFRGEKGSPELWKACEGQDGIAPDKRIEACNVMIDYGGEVQVNVAGAYINRGYALRDTGELDRAVKDFNQAMTIDKKAVGAYMGRAEIFVAKGQLDFALLDYNAAVKLSPKDANVYFNRGTTYSKAGQYDKAIQDFDQAIRLNPNHHAAFNNRCFARAKAGQAQLGLADCEEALRLRPYDADYLDTRAFANLRLGQFDRAMADYSDALDINPKLPSSLYGRGIARLKKGDRRGSADIAAAKAIDAGIAEEFARYGVK
jgi:tetratricopeptide (TPR) repeat protein